MFASSGEATAPWWGPDFCLRPLPFLGHPALSHFWIRRSILRSAMRCSMNLTSHSCDKLSKDTTTPCLHAVERAPTGHRSHAEDEQLLPLTAQLSPRLIPVHLSLLTPPIALWNERLDAARQPQLPLARVDESADSGLRHHHVRHL